MYIQSFLDCQTIFLSITWRYLIIMDNISYKRTKLTPLCLNRFSISVGRYAFFELLQCDFLWYPMLLPSVYFVLNIKSTDQYQFLRNDHWRCALFKDIFLREATESVCIFEGLSTPQRSLKACANSHNTALGGRATVQASFMETYKLTGF